MSDITRDDLRAWPKPRTNHRPVTDEEFDRLAREQGYIRPNADGVADWLRHFGHKVRPGALRAWLTDECDCEDGLVEVQCSHIASCECIPDDVPHEVCGGRGWLLNRPAEDLCDTLADLVAYAPDVHDEFRRELIDWLETEDE